jgi:hypothetical protein
MLEFAVQDSKAAHTMDLEIVSDQLWAALSDDQRCLRQLIIVEEEPTQQPRTSSLLLAERRSRLQHLDTDDDFGVESISSEDTHSLSRDNEFVMHRENREEKEYLWALSDNQRCVEYTTASLRPLLEEHKQTPTSPLLAESRRLHQHLDTDNFGVESSSSEDTRIPCRGITNS